MEHHTFLSFSSTVDKLKRCRTCKHLISRSGPGKEIRDSRQTYTFLSFSKRSITPGASFSWFSFLLKSLLFYFEFPTHGLGLRRLCWLVSTSDWLNHRIILNQQHWSSYDHYSFKSFILLLCDNSSSSSSWWGWIMRCCLVSGQPSCFSNSGAEM